MVFYTCRHGYTPIKHSLSLSSKGGKYYEICYLWFCTYIPHHDAGQLQLPLHGRKQGYEHLRLRKLRGSLSGRNVQRLETGRNRKTLTNHPAGISRHFLLCK